MSVNYYRNDYGAVMLAQESLTALQRQLEYGDQAPSKYPLIQRLENIRYLFPEAMNYETQLQTTRDAATLLKLLATLHLNLRVLGKTLFRPEWGRIPYAQPYVQNDDERNPPYMPKQPEKLIEKVLEITETFMASAAENPILPPFHSDLESELVYLRPIMPEAVWLSIRLEDANTTQEKLAVVKDIHGHLLQLKASMHKPPF